MKMRSISRVQVLLGALALLGLADNACAGPPAANLVSTPLVSPGTAWTFYGTGTTHTNGLAAWSQLPPEMEALARTLGKGRATPDVYSKNVFEYVRNNIETEFRFGLSKGGRGALIDQSGTPFDQAELMVKLLRSGGITASYKIGTITLTAQQFGQWTGLFSTLNAATQAVTVDAASACKLLADGAIPGSCTPASGMLTSITLAHIWVMARIGASDNLYDPSFKPSTLTSGIDIPAAMACGTASASTCGTGMTNAAMTGATSANTTVGGQSVPYVQFLNEPQLNTWLQTAAVNVQTQIQNTNRLARLEDVVGGRRLTLSPTPTIGTTLSYVTTTQATWTGDVPDQFRITLRVRVPQYSTYTSMVLSGAAAGDRTFFADELAGRSLQLHSVPEQTMLVDSTPLAANTCSTCGSLGGVTLDVNHPYATASYCDESIVLALFADSGDGIHAPTGGSLPATIIHGWGNAGPSTERHYSGLQEKLPVGTTTYAELFDGGSLPTVIRTDFATRNQAMLGVRLLTQAAVSDRLISGLSRSAIVRHHSLGIAFAHAFSPGTLANISVQSALSVISATNDSVARTAAFETSASTFAATEGSVNQQLEYTPVGLSTSSYFRDANANLPGNPRRKFLSMTNTQIQAAYASATGYFAGLRNVASTGYGAVFPESGGTEILIGTNSIAHTIGLSLKGGAALNNDPLSRAMESVRLGDAAAARKKYLSVSPANGAATLREPDLVTGTGSFPAALPFQRTYVSDVSVIDTLDATTTNSFNPGTEQQTVTNNYTLQYSGADSAANSHIGGGWEHNYNVTATYTGNGAKALGQDYALEASASIAALRAIYDAARSPTLAGRVSSMLASDWLVRYHWSFNSVALNKGGASESFQRLPDGKFFAPAGATRLEQFGSPNNNDVAAVSFKYTGKDGDTIDFSVGRFIRVTCCGATFMARSLPYFYATSWKFPDGITVDFHYTERPLVESYDPTVYVPCTGPGCPVGRLTVPYGWVLDSVSNTLGRSLTFTTTNSTVPVLVGSDAGPGVPQTLSSRFTITGVTDDSNRTVTYTLADCNFTLWTCDKLTVRGTDGRDSLYGYAPGTDSPNPALTARSSYRLRRWFTPADMSTPYRVLAYDELFRVNTVKDSLGNLTSYFAGAVFGADRWKRSEMVSALGAVTTNYFDTYNNALTTVDPLGRTTTMTYDNANRLLKTTRPEGDSVEQTYDVRSNVLTTVKHSKTGSGYADIAASTTSYVEGATVTVCSNAKTCNKPASQTDARTNTTDYTYDGGTGQLLTVTAPSVPLGTGSARPLTTLCYAPQGGVSMLSGVIEKISTTVNRVKSFTYNSANKYVLQTSTLDPATTLTPPASPSLTCPTSSKTGALNLITTLTFDSTGNLASSDGPRTDATDVTSYTFDKARRITKIAAPIGATTRYCYDADGLLRATHRARDVGLTDPNASTATTNGSCAAAYPAASWQSEVRDYWTTGDLKTVQDADGNVTRYAYDAENRQRVVQDPDGRQSATVYDLAGQVLSTWRGGRTWIDGAGRPAAATPTDTTAWDPATYVAAGSDGPFRYVAYDYTANGAQKRVTDADNNLTDYVYDGHDRLFFTLFPHASAGTRCSVATPVTSATTPTCSSGQTYEKSTYDNNANRLTFRTRKGDTFTWTYDAGNRIQTKAVSGGTPALPTVTYKYTLMDEPLSLTSPVSGSIPAHGVTYDYDAAGRKLFEENLLNGTNRRVSYEYADKVNRTKTIWPDTYYVFYTYDALNRMQYARENSATANELAFYDYDTLSRRKQLRFAAQTGNRIDYTYEPDGDLDLLTNVLSTTNVTLDHGHNKSGQVNSIVANDAFYLPVPAAATSTAYVPDKLNRYTSIGGNAATYDSNGNLLTWFRNGVKQTYTYDAENRLRTAATDGTTTASITYDYDPLGRRISKTVSGLKTFYLLDGDEDVAEYDTAGAVQRRYVMGPAVDDRIARAEGSAITNPTKTYYHVNHQGSVIATANTNGSLAQQLAYDEYGLLTSQQPPASPMGESFRYTGRRFDSETGLYYYRARYYSPELGRFLQTDPVGYKDDFNLYGYVSNDPLNHTDPSGAIIDTLMDSYEVLTAAGRVFGATAAFAVGVATGNDALANEAAEGLREERTNMIIAGAAVIIPFVSVKVVKGIRGAMAHGNSRISTKPQHRYEIRDTQTGDVKKTGISGQKLNADGSSPRANKQVNKLNKQAGQQGQYAADVKETNIPGREAALDAERAATAELKKQGHSLELQCRPDPNKCGVP